LFSPGTPASSTTKTGRHDIAEILLKVALNTKNQSNLKNIPCLNEINGPLLCYKANVDQSIFLAFPDKMVILLSSGVNSQFSNGRLKLFFKYLSAILKGSL
jgi:hypothetical protein